MGVGSGVGAKVCWAPTLSGRRNEPNDDGYVMA